MADSIRQKIMEKYLSMLGDISVANGYTTDFITVVEWRKYPFDSSDLPAIEIQDPESIVVDFDNFSTTWALTLNITIVLKGNETPEDLRNMIQDIHKCLGSDVRCDDWVRDITPVSDAIYIDQKDEIYGSIELVFKVEYVCKSWALNKLFGEQ